MKLEEKKSWVCSDGTEFELEEDALSYEWHCHYSTNEVVCFTKDGEPIIDPVKTPFDEVWYIDIKTEKGLDAVRELFEEVWGADSVEFPSIGLYGYDTFRDKWTSAEQALQDFIKSWRVFIDWKMFLS